MKNGERWLDQPRNVTRIYIALWCTGIALLLADLWIHRHEQLGFAETLGFYCFYGFAACVALVLVAKALRRVLMRAEDYYER